MAQAAPPKPSQGYPTIAPNWVCEVLSESTHERDYGIKKRSYAKLGVQWYWIVSPKRRDIEVYQLFDGTYDLVQTLKGRALPLPPFTDIPIELSTIFDL